jgi:sugar fermentation stimulation protein A
MDLPSPLDTGRLLARYKRFLADVALDDGRTVTAHCPNPGAMTGLSAPGARVWLSRATDPRRKLAHTLELVEADGTLVGINTGRPNALVAEALQDGRLPALAGYPVIRREVKTAPGHRIDLCLEAPGRPPAFVEVKNVHLRRPDGPFPTAAAFPDCVTARGARHMAELARLVAEGARAAVVFAVQRGDCDHFRPAADIDPGYARALTAALAAGVEAFCLAATVTPARIRLERMLPLADLGAPDPGGGTRA